MFFVVLFLSFPIGFVFYLLLQPVNWFRESVAKVCLATWKVRWTFMPEDGLCHLLRSWWHLYTQRNRPKITFWPAYSCCQVLTGNSGTRCLRRNANRFPVFIRRFYHTHKLATKVNKLYETAACYLFEILIWEFPELFFFFFHNRVALFLLQI